MLNPELKYIFNCSKLRKGDILLMDTYRERQRHLMPKDRYLHAAVYLGNAMIAEADGYGVIINHICSHAFKNPEDGYVVRVKGLNSLLADKVIRVLREDVGREYSVREALKVNENRNTEVKDRSKQTFCSRSVAKAFSQCSIPLVPNPDYCSPDDLGNSERVEVVENPLCEIEDDVRSIIEKQIHDRENPDLTITPQLLFEDIRNFFKAKGLNDVQFNIQNFTDMLIAVSNVPEFDGELAEMLRNHPFLKSPRQMTEEWWPWFDNDEEFFNHYPDTREALFFIYNQVDHYDEKFLPAHRETFVKGVFLKILRQDSEFFRILSDHQRRVYKESIRVRRRIAYLYHQIKQQDPDGLRAFQTEVGYLKRVEFEYPTLDISDMIIMPPECVETIKQYLRDHPDELNPEK